MPRINNKNKKDCSDCIVVFKDLSKNENLIQEQAMLLQDTMWCVPPGSLLAYHYDEFISHEHTPVIDQTVWIINKVTGVYFFGVSYTYNKILEQDTEGYQKFTFIGTITSIDHINISFVSTDNTQSNVTATGKLRIDENNNIEFDMSFHKRLSIASNMMHGSYMIQIFKDDKYYKNLPGTDYNGNTISVPELIHLSK